MYRRPALLLTARLALRDYRAVYPTAVLLSSTLPRVLLQVTFIALLGLYAAGREGLEYAFVGGSVYIASLAIIQRGSDVVVDERAFGTLWRLRVAGVKLPLLFVIRWWVPFAEAMGSCLLVIVTLGLLVLDPVVVLELVSALPIYLVICGALVGFALFGAAASAGRQTDVLVTNLMAYLLLALTGVVAPLPSGSYLARASMVLPLTNGLRGLRQYLEGRPLGYSLLAEAAVGVGWLLAGTLLLSWQGRRARVEGFEDFM